MYDGNTNEVRSLLFSSGTDHNQLDAAPCWGDRLAEIAHYLDVTVRSRIRHLDGGFRFAFYAFARSSFGADDQTVKCPGNDRKTERKCIIDRTA